VHPSAAEPYLPAEGSAVLEDLAFKLVREASALAGQLPPPVALQVGELLRSMNCYYSNLIEGHNTHPRDIDKAMAQDYSHDAVRRDLQLEARAHIEVQRLVDLGGAAPAPAASRDFIAWAHREFCSRLPETLLTVTNPDTGEQLTVVPGELRSRPVVVGRHVPPPAADRFEQAYVAGTLTQPRQVVAVAAAHHRLLWIHPFLDGNGRVARLMSHAMFLELGMGSGLWSVSRGLARNVVEYKQLLMAADGPRRGDHDGRGALSEAALADFCRFFLECCLDQVRFMRELLQPADLQRRVDLYVRDEVDAGRLPEGSGAVLREALLAGTVVRGDVARLTGTSDRTARRVTSKLLERKLLVSDSHKAQLRLGIPLEVVERWFPRLYPEAV
jgi:Fic family protein